MKKFKILIPCYNDWKSVFKLLNKIDEKVKAFNAEFSVIIVNDFSKEKIPDLKSNYTKIKSIDIINMKKNQGHSRCFATGIKYLSQKLNFDYLLLMDGDGEDRPEDLGLLIASTIKNKDKSFVAKRIKRSEGYIFTFLYHLHKIITLFFTGKNMNFGHYSCLTKRDVILISTKESLWSNFAGTVKKFISNLNSIPSIRGLRYFGPSKMPLLGLVIHSFSIIATFKYQVLFRSIITIMVLTYFLLNNQNLILIILIFFLVLFTSIIFLVSKRESSEKLDQALTQIDNVTNIHTKRL